MSIVYLSIRCDCAVVDIGCQTLHFTEQLRVPSKILSIEEALPTPYGIIIFSNLSILIHLNYAIRVYLAVTYVSYFRYSVLFE